MRVRRATPSDAEAMARVHTASADAVYTPFVRVQPGGYERRLRVWRDVLGSDHSAYLAANARARRFYERNGWVAAETVTEPHFGGIPTEVVRYRRRFR